MLVGATAIGRDLGHTVSARVATGLTADCTKLEIGDFPINAVPGKEDEQKLAVTDDPSCIRWKLQSQPSPARTTVLRWLPFVLVFKYGFQKRLDARQK